MDLEGCYTPGSHHRASGLFAHRGGLHLRAGFSASPRTQGFFDALDAMQRPCTSAVWRRSWRVKQCLLQLICFSECDVLCCHLGSLRYASRLPTDRDLAVLPIASACTGAASFSMAASGSVCQSRAVYISVSADGVCAACHYC